MDVSTLELATGDAIPAVGLGLWKVEANQAPRLVEQAALCGYRHFDCACDYGNEAAVGDGLRHVLQKNICTRESLWVTSKLWNTYHASKDVRPALEHTLRDLQLEYLDLYLIHFPIALRFVPFEKHYPPGWLFDPGAEQPHMEFVRVPIAETWRAMEELVSAGLVRTIGVCNFNVALLRDLASYAQLAPSVLQVEMHPYLTQQKLVRYCRQEKIAVTAFSPLGASSYLSLGMAGRDESVLDQPVVREIAARHERTPAQVVLRWGLQRGTAVVPKTSRPERLVENLSIFDFELAAEYMDAIGVLNRGRRFNDPGHFCEQAFNTFCPIYE